MSHVRDRRLFEAVYEVTKQRLQWGGAPTALLFQNEGGLVRSVPARYLQDDHFRFDVTKVVDNLKVRDALTDNHRFSGSIPGGPVSHNGGLYTSRHSAPMINEILHYGGGKQPLPQELSQKGVIRLQVVKPLFLMDLSSYSPATEQFLKAVALDGDVKAALKHSRVDPGADLLTRLMSDDYSVARGIGQAAADSPQVDGLRAGTARLSDRDGETGDNVVLYGPNGEPLHQCVRAEVVTLFGYSHKRNEVIPESYPLTYDLTKQQYAAE